jgi:hypothetical protein
VPGSVQACVLPQLHKSDSPGLEGRSQRRTKATHTGRG